jgi:putative transposase
MIVLRAYQTELDLNHAQASACARHAGAARFAYNWGLEQKQAAYRAGEKVPTAIDLHRRLNALKQTDFPWMYEVSKCAPQEALRNLDQAYAHFFRRVKEKKAGQKVKVGFPKFKSKKHGRGSFRLTGTIHVFERAIQLPRLGVLRLKESGYLPTQGVHLLSATVSEKAGRWFVSLQVEQEIPDPEKRAKLVVGVDLGISHLATLSDGTVFENPHALRSSLQKIKRLQRIVSRRQKGSANRRKAAGRLACAHARVANLRKDTLHQITTRLARTKSIVVLEDLQVSGMTKNHHLAQAILDVGWAEFRRQLTYKGKWYGCEVIVADRFFPSTKRCSFCGWEQKIGLGERGYRCPNCERVLDRDLNAAINLEQWETDPEVRKKLRRVPPEDTPVERAEDLRDQAALVEAGTELQSSLYRIV